MDYFEWLYAQKAFNGSDIERDVTSAVALAMNNLKITSMPFLKFFKNDAGAFDNVYHSHMTDAQVELVRMIHGDELYLILLGSHAFGAGAYITLCQDKYGKPVAEFTEKEFSEIQLAFQETDSYELGLKELGIELDGNNKQCIDHIIATGLDAYKKAAGAKAFDQECLKDYMKVLYNAGITMVLRD